MSQLEEQFLEARGVAFRIVAGQLGVTLAVSAAGFLLGDPRAGVSALMGGGIGTLASLHMVITLFRPGFGAEPKRIVGRLYKGEVYKLLVTAGLFTLALVSMNVAFGAMLGGFGATFLVYWAALLRAPALTRGA